ncbi:MAG: HPF/RaiA family ribosome-associated protein [bacterium]|nr:HPF/RaiA family ribosome-associated protein [bacterium]
MEVIVTSKSLPVTKALQAAAVRQARRLLRMGRKILRVRVSFEAVARKKNDTHAMVVQYHVEMPGKDVVVKRRARDIYEALVDAAAQAGRQVRKAKEKRLSSRRGYRPVFAQIEL